ncbi:MAG: ABC transporter permease [Lachnospiraceae bacterium]|nr:ABC transporter permease [Lachnospiraceae bacterium]
MLIRKMLRDIKNNFTQFVTIFAMVTIAMTVYAGICSYGDGMKVSGDRFYTDLNMPDLWLSGEGFTKSDMEKIKAVSGVKDAMRYISISMTGEIEYAGGRKASFTVPMEGNFIDTAQKEITINRFHVTEGIPYDPDAEGMWLGRLFAEARDIHPGDTISLTYEETEITGKVLGIISVPDHVYVTQDSSVIFQQAKDFGWVYMSMRYFPREAMYDRIIESEGIQGFLESRDELALMHENGMSWRDILVTALGDMDPDTDLKTALDLAPGIANDTAGEGEKHDFIKALDPGFNLEDAYVYPIVCVDVEGEAPGIYPGNKDDGSFDKKIDRIKNELYTIDAVDSVTGRDMSSSYASYKSEAEEGDTYSGMFTFLFLFIASLSVVTTMNRFVKKQRMQIGALKALGFRNSRIYRHYISYGFFVSLVGVVTGFAIGIPTLGVHFYDMEMDFYDVSGGGLYIAPKNYIVAVLIVIMVTCVTFFSSRKILSEPAAQTLKLEVPKIKQKKKSEKPGGIMSRLSFAVKWNLRDVARSKARTMMGVVGVAGSTLLIVMAFGMEDSMNHYLDWEFSNILRFKSKLTMDSDITNVERGDLYREYGNTTTQNVPIEYYDGNGMLQTSVITVNDSSGMVAVCDHDQNPHDINEGIPGNTFGDINAPGALYATEKLVINKKIDTNGKIRWHILGSDDWYETKIAAINRDPQAQQFAMTRAAFEGLGEKYEPDTLYTDADLTGVDDEEIDGVSAISTLSSLREQMGGMLNMIKGMLGLFIVMSGLLGFIIIYNMGLLSMSEKMYQFSTLKVLGFGFYRIVKIYTMQNIWITVTGILLGLPMGFVFTDFLFKYAIGEDYDFGAYIEPSAYIIATLGTMAVMIFTSIFLARNIKKIDMVASLKANE